MIFRANFAWKIAIWYRIRNTGWPQSYRKNLKLFYWKYDRPTVKKNYNSIYCKLYFFPSTLVYFYMGALSSGKNIWSIYHFHSQIFRHAKIITIENYLEFLLQFHETVDFYQIFLFIDVTTVDVSLRKHSWMELEYWFDIFRATIGFHIIE